MTVPLTRYPTHLCEQQGTTGHTWRYVIALITNTSWSQLGRTRCFSSDATTHISTAGSTMRSRIARQPSAARTSGSRLVFFSSSSGLPSFVAPKAVCGGSSSWPDGMAVASDEGARRSFCGVPPETSNPSPSDESYTTRISRRICAWSNMANGGVRLASAGSCRGQVMFSERTRDMKNRRHKTENENMAIVEELVVCQHEP